MSALPARDDRRQRPADSRYYGTEMTTETQRTPETNREDIRRFQKNLDDEIDGIAIYELLAQAERDPELAAVEVRHADVWRKKLSEAGVQPREHGPSLKVRSLGWAAGVFGVRSVLPIVRSMEAGAYGAYMAQDEAAQAIAPDEREHRKTVARMSRGAATPSEEIMSSERWHRTGGGGALRASVFGISDGLVSNTALVMGFAGAQTEGKFVLLAGIAGLLAGAFSMAAGEYVSMRAQRELFERQIELERKELEEAPDEERAELALIYQAKGFSEEQAREAADSLMENPEKALDALVREELGLDPSELGSPWGASTGSFFAFAIGAVIPVIPFFAAGSASAPYVAASAALSVAAMFAIGAALSLFTGRRPWLSGGRQVGLGVAAAVLTFVIGRIIGASTGL